MNAIVLKPPVYHLMVGRLRTACGIALAGGHLDELASLPVEVAESNGYRLCRRCAAQSAVRGIDLRQSAREDRHTTDLCGSRT